jgi:hypothetical protein
MHQTEQWLRLRQDELRAEAAAERLARQAMRHRRAAAERSGRRVRPALMRLLAAR